MKAQKHLTVSLPSMFPPRLFAEKHHLKKKEAQRAGRVVRSKVQQATSYSEDYLSDWARLLS